MSRRKAERAFTTEGRSPFEQLVHEAAAEAAYLSNIAQVTPPRRRKNSKPVVYDHDDWLQIAQKAIHAGGTVVRPWLVNWKASGNCTEPRSVTIEARLRKLHWKFATMDGPEYRQAIKMPTAWLDMEVPCRKCPNCLKRRAAHWTQRCINEIAAANRTWRCTFTFKPEEHARIEMEVSRRVGLMTINQLSPEELLLERNVEAGRRLTKWLKRVRKASGASLRYCLTMEAHKSGLPHFHALLHEVDDVGVGWKELSKQWRRHGFSAFKLVDHGPKAARYCAKYLQKSSLARVRASVGYGSRELSPSGQAS